MTDATIGDLDVDYRGYRYALSARLAARQKRTLAEIEVLKGLHREMIDLRWEIHGTADAAERRRLVGIVEDLEFAMQDAWGVGRDATMHTHWLSIPGCRCPMQANLALLGHPARLIAKECPVFGGTTRTDGIQMIPTDRADRPRTMPWMPAPGPSR